MNEQGLISGQTETSLTEKGVEQAKAAGKVIKETLPKIDLIICSPYERTRETAKHIAFEIDYPLDRIQMHELFIERNFGIIEGTSGDDFFEHNEYKDIDLIENAETIEDLDKRAKIALKHIKSLDYDNILIVGHGSFGRAIKRVVNDLPHTHEYEVYTPIGNAEIIELI